MDDERQFVLSSQPLPSHTATRLSTQIFDFAKVARVAAKDLGRDFDTVIQNEEDRILKHGNRVIQIWLSSGIPSVGEAVDHLRHRGYFFGGVLPRWLNSDGLLMEKVLDEPGWQDVIIQFERPKKLLALIKEDREQVLDLYKKTFGGII